jgi:hypothetical protein
MGVSELSQRGDIRRPIDVRRASRKDVDDWLGRHSRNGCASNMLETDWKIVTRRIDPRRFRVELSRPERIVRNELHAR